MHQHKLPTGSSDLGKHRWTVHAPFAVEDRKALVHDRYYHPDPRVQRKMEVLWLKSHGLNHDDIAAYADVSRRTVQRYLDQYLEGGLPRLNAVGIGPRASSPSTKTRSRSTS